MACNLIDKCIFLEKLGNNMPHTKEVIESTYCLDRDKCLKSELAKTIMENLLEGKFPGDK